MNANMDLTSNQKRGWVVKPDKTIVEIHPTNNQFTNDELEELFATFEGTGDEINCLPLPNYQNYVMVYDVSAFVLHFVNEDEPNKIAEVIFGDEWDKKYAQTIYDTKDVDLLINQPEWTEIEQPIFGTVAIVHKELLDKEVYVWGDENVRVK